jgi:hypothetical protein
MEITVAIDDSAKSPVSPKVAVYDEWQELLKNAEKDAEAGTGRSRRARRPRPDEDEPPQSPRKRPRKEGPKSTQITSSGAGEDVQKRSISTDEVAVTEALDSSSIVITSTHHEAKQEVTTNVERTGTGYKETEFGIKIRRNVRSLGGNEISKVKSEMATVQPFLNNTPTINEPTYFMSEKPTSDTKPKDRPTTEDRPIFMRRKS